MYHLESDAVTKAVYKVPTKGGLHPNMEDREGSVGRTMVNVKPHSSVFIRLHKSHVDCFHKAFESMP